jgi:hypothetical protein
MIPRGPMITSLVECGRFGLIDYHGRHRVATPVSPRVHISVLALQRKEELSGSLRSPHIGVEYSLVRLLSLQEIPSRHEGKTPQST